MNNALMYNRSLLICRDYFLRIVFPLDVCISMEHDCEDVDELSFLEAFSLLAYCIS